MSAYHSKGSPGRGNGKADATKTLISREVALSLEAIRQRAKDGLLALCVEVGLNTLEMMFEQELEEKIGKKGKHNADRSSYRHSYEPRKVVLGGRKVEVSKPRARTVDGKEVVLESYEAVKNDEILTRHAFETMLHGLSTRNYAFGLEDVGDVEASGISKSSISRRFARMTQEALAELLAKRLDEIDLVVLYIDGIEVAEHTAVCALGIDIDGKKHILGVWEGATENASVCKGLVTNLAERGLKTDGLLVVIDGSKALRRAVADVLGNDVPVQRCQVHKMRNVLDHLPEEQRPWVKRKLAAAWAEPDANMARKALEALADSLEKNYPGAAASLREGLEETITINRLMLTGALRRTIRSTNPIESAIEIARTTARRVKRWRNGNQVLRWTLAGLKEAERRFRRVAGYRELPLLRMRLKGEVLHTTTSEAANA